MAIPAHRRKRSPFAKQVLGVLVRREPAVIQPTENRCYFLRQVEAGNVKWSHRGGRWHWRCDDTDVSRTIEELASARWVEATGTVKSRHRTLTLTNGGHEALRVV